MAKIDYNKFDKMSLFVKKDMKDEIIKNYNDFGWELVNVKPNFLYDDIVDLTFKRSHYISNKDDLQLLQVYMEDKLNELGKVNKNRNAKSTIFALILGLFGVSFIVCSAIFFLNMQHSSRIFLSSLSLAVGVCLGIVLALFYPKLRKRENEKFIQKTAFLEKELKNFCVRAKKLRGGHCENK